MNTNRREFIKRSTIAIAATTIPFHSPGATNFFNNNRKFKMSLNPGAIGVNADQEELLNMAVKHKFEAIIAYANSLVNWSDTQISDFVGKMNSSNISWGAAGLPIDFRKDIDTYAKGLEDLPKKAAALQKAGVRRMSTWIMPTHPDLTYLQNFKQHSTRLKEITIVLGDYGINFGLEYVGPKTLMASQKYPFLHTMNGCLELIESVNEPNIGLQLDCFHWFCAGETKEDLLRLNNSQIVTCDLNDARAGLSADEQIDQTRELPMATGLVDLKSFLDALVEIGYDGPIRAEPFNQKLRDMDNEEALATTFNAMNKAFKLVG